jgi:hypothetical protein
MQTLTDQLREVASAAAQIGDGAAGYAVLTDADLLDAQTQLGLIRRRYETQAAWAAGEISRRSSRELGFTGLAKRNGFLTPVELIQSASGGTRAEAVKLVAVGTLMGQTEAAEDLQQADRCSPFAVGPWLAVVAGAVRSGTLSVDAAEAIRQGLGQIDPGVPAEKLAEPAAFLVGEAASLNVEQLHRRARRLCDQLDAVGPTVTGPRPGAKLTTSMSGKPTTAQPTRPMASCSARPTTYCCTTLLLHNNGWHIRRTRADYWLLPPATLHTDQTPIPMPSKSSLMLELFSPTQSTPTPQKR